MVNTDFTTLHIGVINYAGQIFAIIREVLAYLVNENGGLFWWADGSGQLYVTGNLPTITTKGEDIIAAIMTIVHQGLVFAAEFTTLLPSNALAPVPAG